MDHQPVTKKLRLQALALGMITLPAIALYPAGPAAVMIILFGLVGAGMLLALLIS